MLVPPGEPFAAGEVTSPSERDVVVLVRRTQRSTRSQEPVLLPISETVARDDEDDAPVRVIGSSEEPAPPAPDPAVARILALMRTDPPGTWLARRITLRIVPG